MKYLRILAVFIGLAFSFNTFVLAASINSIALFNFKPISMDAIGADAELLYSLETSLNKSPQISVMSRRDMEAVLYRIGGAQVTDTDLVIAYGQEMGVSFVLTGEIDKIGSSIQVTIKLVDVIARRISQTWTESYNSRGDVLQHSKILALAIKQAIIQSSTANDAAASDDSTTEEIEYFHDIKAVAKDSGVFISWVINDDVSAFYTNVYRGESADGLFEFVASVEETQYQDDVQGHYFYRLDLVLDNGSEIKGQQIVSAETFGTVVDTSLQPPTILSSKNLLHGIKIDFVPQLNNQGILGYNFYQKVNDNQWKKVHSIAKGSQLSYSVILDKNFIANADYQLYVTAYSNTGESDHSEILTLHTEPALILKSDGIKRLRKAQLSWQHTNKGNGYNIYRKDNIANTWQRITKITNINRATFSDEKQLQDGHQYSYTIAAFDQFTETPRSAEIIVYTKELPLAPTNLITQSTLVKKVKLTWQAINDSDISGYVIFRKAGEFKSGDLLTEVAFVKGYQQHEYIDGNDKKPLIDGETYHYAIAAKNLFGAKGSVTTAVNATTKALPAQPKNLTVSAEQNFIRIDWQKNEEEDLDHYSLYRKWNQEPWIKLANINDTYYEDHDLKAYAKTSYKLSATDKESLTSTFSAVQQIDSPLTLQLSIAQDNLLRTIILAWHKVEHINGYKVYRKARNQSSWKLVKTITATEQQRYQDFDKKQLREGSKYQYQLTAFDDFLETPASNIVQGKTKNLPSPPTNFSATTDQVKKVILTWNKSIDHDDIGYIIQRKNKKGYFEEIEKITNIATSQYQDDGSLFSSLSDGAHYYYKIASYNKFSAVGNYSEVIDATTKAVPTTIAGLSIKQKVNGLQVSWQAIINDDLRQYQIYRSSNNSCSGLHKVAKVNRTNVSYVDVDVKSGKDYCYRVTAIDNDNLEGKLSPSVSFSMPIIEQEN